jgi:hypothetical protein
MRPASADRSHHHFRVLVVDEAAIVADQPLALIAVRHGRLKFSRLRWFAIATARGVLSAIVTALQLTRQTACPASSATSRLPSAATASPPAG